MGGCTLRERAQSEVRGRVRRAGGVRPSDPTADFAEGVCGDRAQRVALSRLRSHSGDARSRAVARMFQGGHPKSAHRPNQATTGPTR